MDVEQLREFFKILEDTRGAIQSVTCDSDVAAELQPIINQFALQLLEIVQKVAKQ